MHVGMSRGLGRALALAGLIFAVSGASAAPPMKFVDLASPEFSVNLGETQVVKRFTAVAEPNGVKLRNSGTRPIEVQDVVSLAKLTLEPGAQIGLSCESVRHLALSIGDSVIYESAPCGSLLRISDAMGGAE